MKKSIYFLGFWSLLLTIAVACSSDDDAAPATPVASFQSEADADNFLQITFSNFSTNYATSAWSFGDGEISTDENPVHTYAEAGTYSVSLTVVNSAGTDATITKDVVVSDPNAKLTLLAGTGSKTWKLLREGTAMLLASDANYTQIYWAGSSNDGQRPCYYDDTFTFGRDGSYVFDDAGTFWAEYGVFNNAGCAANTVGESCFEAIAANMVNECGDDVSAWLSGTHNYTYDATNDKITLIGEGAWMGIPKLGTDSDANLTPQSSVTFEAILVDGGDSGVDTLHANFEYAGTFWPITYVSYSDASLEPALVTEYVAPPFGEDLVDITPSSIFNTFASDTDFAVFGSIGGGSTITVGVDDPTDATAAKVGKFERVAGTDYQEAQIRTSPDNNDVILTNFTTVSLDVYIPSSNDYTGSLCHTVVFGLADQSATEQWWTDLYQWETADVAEDTWTTLTFDLASPSNTTNSPLDRTDLDMFFINIGCGGHGDGGTFYVRNLEFN